jgi:toxin ParE1/3/4
LPRVEWLAAALTDLLDIVDYISAYNRKAAQDLKDLIETSVARLPDNPKMGRHGRAPGTRELVVHPSYIVVYRETRRSIAIVGVIHSARQWPSRPL